MCSHGNCIIGVCLQSVHTGAIFMCPYPPASWESTKVTGEGSCERAESSVSRSLRMCSVRGGEKIACLT